MASAAGVIVIAFIVLVALLVWGARVLIRRIRRRLRERAEHRSRACLQAAADDLHRRGSATTPL